MNGRGDSVTVVAAEEENWIFVTDCLKQVSIATPYKKKLNSGGQIMSLLISYLFMEIYPFSVHHEDKT